MLNSTATLRPAGLSGKSFNFSLSNEQKLSPQSFEEWRNFIYNLCGIYFKDNKKYLLESRLQKRIKYLNLANFDEYLQYLKTNPKKEQEKEQLYEAITINETYFFRNKPQLDALITNVIPDLLEKKSSSLHKIKIWSAASSSGEEAYSIAMMIDEMILPKYPRLKVEIIGTDINYTVIENARKAVFKEYSIRNTPPVYLKKYFKKDGVNYILNDKIKNMVSFKVLNLYDDRAISIMTKSDVIFCANVLIYFDTDSKIKVVNNLYKNLNPEGYLFIGYSETLHGISKAFKLTSFPKTIGYKKG
ncbi:MAG: chemotaxis protein CheR [Ignavibacteriae bacterium]|nr:MAG: chemotaxis protein CheR [Ignavibacteriota bacterium]